MRVYKLLIILLMFSACKTPKQYVSGVDTTVKDSTFVTERIVPRDTLIVVPADSLKLSAKIEELTEKAVIKRTARMRLSLKRVGNRVIADCKNDSLLLQIALLEKEIQIRKEVFREQRRTVIEVVKYVPQVVKWLAWIGGGLVVFLIGRGVLKAKGLWF